ncbi:uncharacterized protein LOC126581668 [Anopheles aquasalis]|uniref:uncharacterized protein LOC126581668 n=1 Tax=Anopheles aquasalis TaxID=42839 RepID=UPI00215B0CEB|nr:uncharacterized protein LOC126581668 [Anopheles aquasalis]
MKLFGFYSKNVYIQYRNQLCSTTTFVVCSLTIIAFVAPYYALYSIKGGELWEQHRLVYEQPRVKFPYKYLVLAEFEGIGDGESSVLTCSSFEGYNSATEQLPSCNAIRVIPIDEDNDQTMDRLRVTISFNPPDDANGLRFYTVYYFLETTLTSQCNFEVPAFVYLDKLQAPAAKFLSGKIEHHGVIQAKQSTSLQCPFFMRQQKSHFSARYYPTENSTLEEFQPKMITGRIESSNPAYFEYSQTRTGWISDESGVIDIEIDISIGGADSQATALLYRTSLWQRLSQFWTSYFPLLFVSLWIANKVKMYLFENFYLRAVEVLPWKQKYT